uniref:Cell cycle checkpoint control protein n=2 Tax=Clastoptera arizonana TaxID=38151 RepID=A0A1B6CP83_9HEMI
MKCVIPSLNVKILARAVHSLSKIGDDLFVEPSSKYFALRTVNMAQSAYAIFTFFDCFFSSYNFDGTGEIDENSLTCKISMKACISVFKTPTCMDKQVEWCQIRCEPDGTQLVFKIRYINGATKTHFLPILENETLEANYGKNTAVNRLFVTPKTLSSVVKNFRPNIDEITLSVSNEKAILKTHVDSSDSKKAVRTELCLFASEFESYVVGVETSITFCLKEMKAVLAFAEPTNLPIMVQFDTPGRPVVFIINNSGLYEANYVVSTLNGNVTRMNTSQKSDISVGGKSNSIIIQENNNKNKRKRSFADDSSKDLMKVPLNVGNDLNVNATSDSQLKTKQNSPDKIKYYKSNLKDPNSNKLDLNLAYPSSSFCNLTGIDSLTLVAEMECEEIPASPPKTIERKVFHRCFNTTFHNRMIPGYEKILAYDSDGMEDSE